MDEGVQETAEGDPGEDETPVEAPAEAPEEAPAEAREEASKVRRVAFGVIATLGGLLLLASTGWYAIDSFAAFSPNVVHRVHNIAGLAGWGVMLGLPLLIAAWRPAKQIAAFQEALVVSIAALIAGLLSTDLAGGGYVPLVIVAVLIALHPVRRALYKGAAEPSTVLVVLAILTAVPAMSFAFAQAKVQRAGMTLAPDSPHVELHHFSTMAAFAIGVLFAALLASMRTRGWRVVSWTTSLSVAMVAGASLAYPAFTGALPGVWPWLAIAWAAVFLVVSEVYAAQESAQS